MMNLMVNYISLTENQILGFIGNKKVNVIKELKDKNGRILILDTEIDDSKFILINLYNANFESEQLNTLEELTQLLGNLEINGDKNIIFSGDFNVFFNSTLEAKGGSPTLKKHSIAKFIEIKEMLDVCDIWRIRNPKIKKKKKNFMAPFYGWGSTASRLQSLRGGSLLFTIQFPEIPGTHFIDLRRMKG